MSNFIIHEASYKFDGSLKLANERLNADQTPRVTFWGTRIVKFDGQDISLNTLAKQVFSYSKPIAFKDIVDPLTLEDKVAGMQIGKKLIIYYKISDEQIRNSNFITRFLVWISECGFFTHTPLHIYPKNYILFSEIFQVYTTEKFLAQFGGSVVDKTHFAVDDFNKNYVIAKEEAMRAQLEKEKAAPGLGITTRVFSYVTNICSYPLYLLNLQKN